MPPSSVPRQVADQVFGGDVGGGADSIVDAPIAVVEQRMGQGVGDFGWIGDNPQLLLDSPAPPPFSAANDLNRAVRHRLTVDLTVGFKVDSLGIVRRFRTRLSSLDELLYTTATNGLCDVNAIDARAAAD